MTVAVLNGDGVSLRRIAALPSAGVQGGFQRPTQRSTNGAAGPAQCRVYGFLNLWHDSAAGIAEHGTAGNPSRLPLCRQPPQDVPGDGGGR